MPDEDDSAPADSYFGRFKKAVTNAVTSAKEEASFWKISSALYNNEYETASQLIEQLEDNKYDEILSLPWHNSFNIGKAFVPATLRRTPFQIIADHCCEDKNVSAETLLKLINLLLRKHKQPVSAYTLHLMEILKNRPEVALELIKSYSGISHKINQGNLGYNLLESVIQGKSKHPPKEYGKSYSALMVMLCDALITKGAEVNTYSIQTVDGKKVRKPYHSGPTLLDEVIISFNTSVLPSASLDIARILVFHGAFHDKNPSSSGENIYHNPILNNYHRLATILNEGSDIRAKGDHAKIVEQYQRFIGPLPFTAHGLMAYIVLPLVVARLTTKIELEKKGLHDNLDSRIDSYREQDHYDEIFPGVSQEHMDKVWEIVVNFATKAIESEDLLNQACKMLPSDLKLLEAKMNEDRDHLFAKIVSPLRAENFITAKSGAEYKAQFQQVWKDLDLDNMQISKAFRANVERITTERISQLPKHEVNAPEFKELAREILEQAKAELAKKSKPSM